MNRTAALLAAALAPILLVAATGPCAAQELNPQPLPPKSGTPDKSRVVSSKTQFRQDQINALNPQPLPPKQGPKGGKGEKKGHASIIIVGGKHH